MLLFQLRLLLKHVANLLDRYKNSYNKSK